MIYHPMSAGKVLTTPEVSTLINETDFLGYLSKPDLLNMLHQIDCVGIRVYYALENATGTNFRALAVGVRQNGSEKDGRGGVGYVFGSVFNPAGTSSGTMLPTREEARTMVEFAMNTGKHPRFSSFFSVQMITNLLADKGTTPVEGIGFYSSVIGSINIPTHIGAAFVNPGNLQRIQNNPAFSHIQSDMPCPGVCSVLAPGETEASATAETMASVSTQDAVLYLVRWNSF